MKTTAATTDCRIERRALVSESSFGHFIELQWTVKASDKSIASGNRIGQISRRLNHAIKMDKQYLRRHGLPTGKDAPPMVCWSYGSVLVRAQTVIKKDCDLDAMKTALTKRGMSFQNVLF